MTENQQIPTQADLRAEAVRKGHTHAASVLKDNHKDEYNRLVAEHVKAAGFEWAPKKTQEEKDRETFEALLAANPQFAAIAQGGADEDGDA